MNYELTTHARTRIKSRKIELRWLEAVLSRPTLIEADEDDPSLEHRLGKIVERDGRILRVVCRPTSDSVEVITVHFDRGMKGKL